MTKPQEWSSAALGIMDKGANSHALRRGESTWRALTPGLFPVNFGKKEPHTPLHIHTHFALPGSCFENIKRRLRERYSKRGKRKRVFCTRLGVGKFSTLQGSHVTSQSKLLAVQPLQIFLPLHDLAGDLALGLGVAHHALLQVGHVLQLVVLQHAIHTGHVSPAIVTFCGLVSLSLSLWPPPPPVNI